MASAELAVILEPFPKIFNPTTAIGINP